MENVHNLFQDLPIAQFEDSPTIANFHEILDALIASEGQYKRTQFDGLLNLDVGSIEAEEYELYEFDTRLWSQLSCLDLRISWDELDDEWASSQADDSPAIEMPSSTPSIGLSEEAKLSITQAVQEQEELLADMRQSGYSSSLFTVAEGVLSRISDGNESLANFRKSITESNQELDSLLSSFIVQTDAPKTAFDTNIWCWLLKFSCLSYAALIQKESISAIPRGEKANGNDETLVSSDLDQDTARADTLDLALTAMRCVASDSILLLTLLSHCSGKLSPGDLLIVKRTLEEIWAGIETRPPLLDNSLDFFGLLSEQTDNHGFWRFSLATDLSLFCVIPLSWSDTSFLRSHDCRQTLSDAFLNCVLSPLDYSDGSPVVESLPFILRLLCGLLTGPDESILKRLDEISPWNNEFRSRLRDFVPAQYQEPSLSDYASLLCQFPWHVADDYEVEAELDLCCQQYVQLLAKTQAELGFPQVTEVNPSWLEGIPIAYRSSYFLKNISTLGFYFDSDLFDPDFEFAEAFDACSTIATSGYTKLAAVFLADSILFLIDGFFVRRPLPFVKIHSLLTELGLWDYAEDYILPAIVIYHLASGHQSTAETIWLKSLLAKYSSAELRVIYDSPDQTIKDVFNEPPRWASGDEELMERLNKLSDVVRTFAGASEDSWSQNSKQYVDLIRGIAVGIEDSLTKHFNTVQEIIKDDDQMQDLVQGDRRKPILHDRFNLGWLALITRSLVDAAKYRESEFRRLCGLIEEIDCAASALVGNLSKLDHGGWQSIDNFVKTRNKVMHKPEGISFLELMNLSNLAFKLLDRILKLP